MKKNNKICIITGITSFLGRSEAKFLIKKGYTVYGILRPDSSISKVKNINGLKFLNIDFDKISIEDFAKFVNSDTSKYIDNIKKSNVDITLIHFGWGSTLDRNNFASQMLNIDYSKKVLEFAKIMGAKRFIFAGSQAEMSESAYGLAKKEFANYAIKHLKDTDMNFIHMRIFSIYGKEDRETSLLKCLVKSIKENKDFDLSSCEYKWNFLFIDDFVKIVYKLITKNVKTGTYDIASDDTRFLKDYVLEAHKVLKGKNKLNFGAIPDSLEKFAIPDITETLSAVGKINFTKFCQGIKRLI